MHIWNKFKCCNVIFKFGYFTLLKWTGEIILGCFLSIPKLKYLFGFFTLEKLGYPERNVSQTIFNKLKYLTCCSQYTNAIPWNDLMITKP